VTLSIVSWNGYLSYRFVPVPSANARNVDPDGRFTIQELSRASGVSVPSIKFYVREGLLPAGDATRPKRAYYGAAHVRRLAVIRALREVAELPVEVVRRALEAVDAAATDSIDVIAPAIDALEPRRATAGDDDTLVSAREEVNALFARHRMVVRRDAGSRETFARALAAVKRLGLEVGPRDLDPYVHAVRALAAEEIGSERSRTLLLGDKEGALEIAIIGSLLFEPMIVALRRAFHEHFATALVRRPSAKRARARRRRA